MNEKVKRSKILWLLGLGACVLGVAAVFFFTRGGGDVLLLKEDVPAAREHVRLREELREIEARIAAAGEQAPPKLDAQRALLASRLRKSRFAAMSIEDLQQGLAAADAGRTRTRPRGSVARGIYGKDDRLDYGDVVEAAEREHQHHERKFLEKALAVSTGVGAWMHVGNVRPQGNVHHLEASTLQEVWRLCSDERFASQPAAALGTAFLVSPRAVATADHVLDDVSLTRLVLVFDYEVRDGEVPETVREVYYPRRVLSRAAGKTHDWAIVELEKDVQDRHVFALADNQGADRLRRDDDIYMWGHSAGTPKKMTRGTVRSADGAISIRAVLDAFGGDSGSPILNRDHEVVGVLFGGSEDFAVSRGRGGCREAEKVRRGAGGEYVTRVDLFRDKIPR